MKVYIYLYMRVYILTEKKRSFHLLRCWFKMTILLHQKTLRK